MGRFRDPPDPVFHALNASISFDRRLGSYDVRQSQAHVAMLAEAGILTAQEAEQLLRGLDQVAAELEGGTFEFLPDDEDIHMAIERRLTEVAGPVGGKVHTARSRNDQVATDMALFVRDQADGGAQAAARADGSAGRPGRAPRRLADAGLYPSAARAAGLPRAPPARVLLDVPPRPRPLRDRFVRDRRVAAWRGCAGGRELGHAPRVGRAQLGFDGVVENSLDAVSNRDFVFDYLSAASICSMHLSRLGAEIVLWSSEEFGFLALGDSFTSGRA